jgi:hypothetical protein
MHADCSPGLHAAASSTHTACNLDSGQPASWQECKRHACCQTACGLWFGPAIRTHASPACCSAITKARLQRQTSALVHPPHPHAFPPTVRLGIRCVTVHRYMTSLHDFLQLLHPSKGTGVVECVQRDCTVRMLCLMFASRKHSLSAITDLHVACEVVYM